MRGNAAVLSRLYLAAIIASALLAGCFGPEDDAAGSLAGSTTSVSLPGSDVADEAETPENARAVATTSAALSLEQRLLVTSTADSGPGTLRRALQDAQDHDRITFDPVAFPPEAPVRIMVESELPHIRVNNLIVDASDAGVILDGRPLTGDWTAGLQIVSSQGSRIMGLRISHFPGPGIAISGGANHNVVGGDRGRGDGPYGEGNLLTGNVVGIDLATTGTTRNTVEGNLIGTDQAGTDYLGNDRDGVSITEGAHDNTIGPNNIIANNGRHGVHVDPADTDVSTVAPNSIYDNGVGKTKRPAPTIFDFELSTGTATGGSCAHCVIDIYSTNGGKEYIFEGQATADELGVYTLDKGAVFAGPSLVAKATDNDGYTSGYSWATSGPEQSLVVQQGNDRPKTQFLSLHSGDLADNRIATQFDSFGLPEESYDLAQYASGVTRARVAIAGLEPDLVDWAKPEFSIAESHDEVFTRMADKGLTITYVLLFWDKATYPGGVGAPCARFKTEGEIERYLDFVRFTVDHFKDRVEYFEIWNEPDIRGFCPKWIEAPDYIELVKRTVPVIREVFPAAKIVVGGVSNTRFPEAHAYLFDLLESDIMPLVDVVSWHPMYGTSPEYDLYEDYHYQYPNYVQTIKETATANGFAGEYRADELSWNTAEDSVSDQPWVYDPVVANKYFARAAVMHLGLGIDVGLGAAYFSISNISTAMAGAQATELPVEIQGTVENAASYSFVLPDGDYLIGLWTNGVAVENDAGAEGSLIIPGVSARRVVAIDVLTGVEQELVFEKENDALVLRDLLIRDYPILVRFVDPVVDGS